MTVSCYIGIAENPKFVFIGRTEVRMGGLGMCS
jgi:hypothetical protein